MSKSSTQRVLPTLLHGKVVAAAPINEIPRLQHGLDAALRERRWHFLRNSKTSQFNFSPSLLKLPQPQEFNYAALPPFRLASQDSNAKRLALQSNAKFYSSTSSLVSALSLFYRMFSGNRKVNESVFSSVFSESAFHLPRAAKRPTWLRLSMQDPSLPTYAVDKIETAPFHATILSDMGFIIEKRLTLDDDEFSLFSSTAAAPHQSQPVNDFNFTKFSDILVRSQIDCYDAGTGVFDLKSRAVAAIRNDITNWPSRMNTTVRRHRGLRHSFELEYYDMLRNTMIKYFFQVKLGNMAGIFVAYHNIQTLFGFQYVTFSKMARDLFLDVSFANGVFSVCVQSLNVLLNTITNRYQGEEILFIYLEPVNDTLECHIVTPTSGETLQLIFTPFVNGQPQSLEQANTGIDQEPWEVELIINHNHKGIRSIDSLRTLLKEHQHL